jgi:hypothetical protein
MRAWMLDDIVAKGVVFHITCDFRRLGRLEAHVVPAEILEAGTALAEALRPHGRARSPLAGQQTGGERGERLCFSHVRPPH